ncbi:Uridine phosphorylase 1 [Cichlidogyrus casuarinus]|uniref:Uridine phosphorylase 1 n=1 Tax=Cichlidogyrus casuarinus TaxID=1844966 RepID=A0ABD2PLX8_9PLAT
MGALSAQKTFMKASSDSHSWLFHFSEQGRLDGAICEYSNAEKVAFLDRAKSEGVKNIEMESLVFGAICNKLATVICVVIVDRSKSDQVIIGSKEREEFEDRPAKIIAQLVREMTH